MITSFPQIASQIWLLLYLPTILFPSLKPLDCNLAILIQDPTQNLTFERKAEANMNVNKISWYRYLKNTFLKRYFKNFKP